MSQMNRCAVALGAWLLVAGGRGGAVPIPLVPVDEQICFAMYTVHGGVLKLTAQLYPVRSGVTREVRLEVKRRGDWVVVGRAEASEPGWAATFRVADWDASRDVPYRLRHGNTAEYEGTVRRDPADKESIVVAAFSGNAMGPGADAEIPKIDIVQNIKKLKPDLLFFAGPQVCAHKDHLAHWLKFGRDFGTMLRQCPSVCLPAADDLGQSALWGSGGRRSAKESGEDGGYFAPVAYVEEVQRAQMSHLPDPVDPAPAERGISVFHTVLTVGRVSFAIIEDRKFKSAPEGLVPLLGSRPDRVTTNAYDAASLDAAGAELLGERQIRFLRGWGADWSDCEMKAVLSQSVFCGGAHLLGSRDNRVYADLDSNGWPQTGRNRALAELRRAFAVHIAGGRGLGAVFHQGIDDWNDASVAFAVPPLANETLCWWKPLEPGRNRPAGAAEHLGGFLDGFGNKVTALAIANPGDESLSAGKLTTRGAGFGVIRFQKPTREVTFECWPRNVDIGDKGAAQYPGWPITVRQEDNYIREAVAHLPTIEIKGIDDPMVQVIDDANGETTCMLRLKGKGTTTFKAKVYRDGPHTVRVGSGDKVKLFPGVMPAGSGGPPKIEADFSPPPPPEPEGKTDQKKRRKGKG